MSQHSGADWSADVEELCRLVWKVFPKVGWDLKQNIMNGYEAPLPWDLKYGVPKYGRLSL